MPTVTRINRIRSGHLNHFNKNHATREPMHVKRKRMGAITKEKPGSKKLQTAAGAALAAAIIKLVLAAGFTLFANVYLAAIIAFA